MTSAMAPPWPPAPSPSTGASSAPSAACPGAARAAIWTQRPIVPSPSSTSWPPPSPSVRSPCSATTVPLRIAPSPRMRTAAVSPTCVRNAALRHRGCRTVSGQHCSACCPPNGRHGVGHRSDVQTCMRASPCRRTCDAAGTTHALTRRQRCLQLTLAACVDMLIGRVAELGDRELVRAFESAINRIQATSLRSRLATSARAESKQLITGCSEISLTKDCGNRAELAGAARSTVRTRSTAALLEQ